ncbi:MAG: CopD family protein [Nevskiales bacterium]
MLASMGVALGLHVLFAMFWVGGMFFAYQCLRPAVAELTPGDRTALWARVLGNFFRWVLIALPVILASGLWMMMNELPVVPVRVHIMLGLGILMMLLFLHVYFAPFRRLKRAVAAGDTALAAAQVGTIRKLVAVNLSLGITVVLIATAGRYLLN